MSGKELVNRQIPAIQWSSAILPILNEGLSLKLPFEGFSMYPLLTGGRDEVLVATVSGKKLKRGDIVLFMRNDGTHVLHRIHHIKNKMYYMLGDAQTSIEGPVDEGDVLAVVTDVIRNQRTISCRQYDYRIISALWLVLRPIRPLILGVLREYKKIRKSKRTVC